MMQQGDNTGGPEAMNLPPVVERIAKQTPENKAPICVLMVGMAGSGKTTLMAQLQQSTVSSSNNEEGEPNEEQAVAQEEGDAKNEKPAPDSGNKGEQDTKKVAKRAEMPAYCVNLDPATLNVPYNASIDIRDTVDYKASRPSAHPTHSR